MVLLILKDILGSFLDFCEFYGAPVTYCFGLSVFISLAATALVFNNFFGTFVKIF